MINMTKSIIFTNREMKVIEKKINNKRLNQVDSNYLYKFIKPKLKEMASVDAKDLLDKMKYNQKIKSIEDKIKKIILENTSNVDSIILYGSIIQNNYKDYNDIDIIIVTKKKLYKKEIDKWKKIKELRNIFKKYNMVSDIQITNKGNFIKGYKNSPTLIYQLKDNKVIYGKIKIPKKTELYNIDLHMKLDWSTMPERIRSTGKEIYSSLRNTILVRLLLNKIVDNRKLKDSLYDELGKNLIERLKNNHESKLDRKIALNYLKELIKKTREEIKGGLWEKIEL